MKISNININNFKRFTNLKINNIPDTAKLILIVGPNGSGKTSLFDAFNIWYRIHSQFSYNSDNQFYIKDNTISNGDNIGQLVDIKFHDNFNDYSSSLRNKFYFRTAYRNQPDFTINQLQKQNDPTQSPKINNFIQNDIAVSENYQRLISLTLSGVYNVENDHKSIHEFREKLVGKIRESINNVFYDLTLSSIGDPLSNGSFYFEKGSVKNFHYKNLSAGEKSAFDIILDLIIKLSYYPDAIFCIDEPESHMHTRLQSSLLQEIYNLIPETSQLWIATHSLGMLKKAKEIENKYPGKVIFINFDNVNFDNEVVLEPAQVDKTIWNKFIEIALDDFSNLVAPSKIVFCEGTSQGRKYKNFDAQIYTRIFQNKYPEVSFVSIGSCNDFEKDVNPSINVVNQILKNSEVIKLVDRDDRDETEINELNDKGIKVLKRRHIECYLLDDEILKKLCIKYDKEEKVDELLAMKEKCIQNSIARNNPSDDIKSASADIYVEIKKLLSLKQCGNTKDAFLRDIIAHIITEETNVFKELEEEIFR